MKLKRKFSLRFLFGALTLAALVALALSPTTVFIRVSPDDAIQGILVPGDWVDIIAVKSDGTTATAVKSVRISEIDTDDRNTTLTVRISNFQKWWLRGEKDYRIAILADRH